MRTACKIPVTARVQEVEGMLRMVGDAVIVGRAVGFDVGDFMPVPGVPERDCPVPGDFRYELDPEPPEPCECLPVWDGEN